MMKRRTLKACSLKHTSKKICYMLSVLGKLNLFESGSGREFSQAPKERSYVFFLIKFPKSEKKKLIITVLFS